ncbi:Chaperonin Cpn60/TCP-1 [Cynara cardunculus var. scolymus]|uniref:Chaperonin Cpn60/TCP-1 n=1 Tax=Cynara cardunculus var. scolymus TaxID=59895 RepID=A0A103XCA1_CYNCS|nr:Chaperonin Cpn60/TCP-1 [Cynara cardunculus var. scolymus]
MPFHRSPPPRRRFIQVVPPNTTIQAFLSLSKMTIPLKASFHHSIVQSNKVEKGFCTEWGNHTVANDGTTILEQMDVDNQIGKLMVELSEVKATRLVMGWWHRYTDVNSGDKRGVVA